MHQSTTWPQSVGRDTSRQAWQNTHGSDTTAHILLNTTGQALGKGFQPSHIRAHIEIAGSADRRDLARLLFYDD